MHNINKIFHKNQAKMGFAAFSMWGKLLELLGLPQLEPVPVKNFEKRQRNNGLPNPNGARIWN